MKLDQIAYYAHTKEQEEEIKRQLGLLDKEWVEDEVTGEVTIHNNGEIVENGASTAHLRFNYDLGIEVEILTYLDGPHWHMKRPEFEKGEIFLSHVGLHMDKGEVPPCSEFGALIQSMNTLQHTNPFLIENGRKYYYEIYDRSSASIPSNVSLMGTDLKFIWRIEQ